MATMTEILGDIGNSAKNLVVQEGDLIRTELKVTLKDIGVDLRNVVFFGLLSAVAVVPLVIFFIIGLGLLLGERYWLSSLIVAIVWGGGAGYGALHYLKELKKDKVNFPSTTRTIEASTDTVKQKVNEVKNAIEL